MIKKYISILELIPTLIGDEEKPRENMYGLFPSKDRDRGTYYYEVEETDSPSKKQLHFKSLKNKIVRASQRIAQRSGHRYYEDYDDDNCIRKPYILNRSYQVPHILELEFLKKSPYGNLLESEHFDFIENILYQYILFYDRIVNFGEDVTPEGMHHYRNTQEDSELYQNIQPFIIEKDTDDEDFDEFVKETIMGNYEVISKIRKPTKKVLRFMPDRMYACRNLEELLEIANKFIPRHTTELERFNSAEGLSKSIPLLMLYSVIAQQEQDTLLPSYRSYHAIFKDYPYGAKGEMRESLSAEEYREEYISLNYLSNGESEEKPLLYKYGANTKRHSSYIEYHDERINMFLFPHIMNQIRIAYFHTNDKMAVPQELMRDFKSEPWKHLVQPETILNQRNLDWSEA